MVIERLVIDAFRNLSHVELACSERFNLLYGLNGSGKTSLLEAIYYLGFNRSFRSHLNNRIIQYGQQKLSVFAKTSDHQLGIERDSQQFRIRADNQDVKSISQIAHMLPLQIIHAHTDQLLEGGPECRRQFLDWGVFHVEHTFLTTWRKYMQALRQRNQALRQKLPLNQLTVWDPILIEAALLLDQYRRDYLSKFLDSLRTTLYPFLPYENLELHYYQGWNKEQSLAESLMLHIASDREMGFTQSGPHRADIKIHLGKIPAKDALSRGQQKMFVSAMQLAQGRLMKTLTNKSPIYLIDDLSSELDEEKRATFCGFLEQLEAQVFVTCIEIGSLAPYIRSSQPKMFHVEHGQVVPV